MPEDESVESLIDQVTRLSTFILAAREIGRLGELVHSLTSENQRLRALLVQAEAAARENEGDAGAAEADWYALDAKHEKLLAKNERLRKAMLQLIDEAQRVYMGDRPYPYLRRATEEALKTMQGDTRA